MPSSPLVAIRAVLRTGSQNDPPGKEGLAALKDGRITLTDRGMLLANELVLALV